MLAEVSAEVLEKPIYTHVYGRSANRRPIQKNSPPTKQSLKGESTYKKGEQPMPDGENFGIRIASGRSQTMSTLQLALLNGFNLAGFKASQPAKTLVALLLQARRVAVAQLF